MAKTRTEKIDSIQEEIRQREAQRKRLLCGDLAYAAKARVCADGPDAERE